MQQGAEDHHTGTGRHRRRYQSRFEIAAYRRIGVMAVVIAGDLRIAPPMAARQQFGATVLGRECIDSDDRRHADRRPWPRNPIELIVIVDWLRRLARTRSEEHTSELQSLMRISYAVFCLKKKKQTQ